MYDKQIMKRCVNLAKAECANRYGKDCVPEDHRCHLINTRYATIAEGALDCDWFLEAVLPLDKELCKEVLQALNEQDEPTGDRTRWCAICNAAFIPTSPRQKYCVSCGERAKQLRNRKKQRKYDEKKRTEKRA